MTLKTILITCAVGGASSLVYLIYFYHSLSRKVEHFHFVGQLPAFASSTPPDKRSSSASIQDQLQFIESLPSSFQTEPENFYVFYDICAKTVPKSTLSETLTSDPSHLLTLLLRRNMAVFVTRLPQAWLTRLLISRKIPSLLPSFNPTNIRALDFKPGDLVAGMYRVVLRSPTRVEFGIGIPPGSGIDLPPIDARLVFTVEIGESKREDERGIGEVAFRTQTIQYRLHEQRDVVLPLEKSVFRWLHNLASWWLLESGVAWLSQVTEAELMKGEL